MGAFSDYAETALVNHIFRATAFTAPTTLAVALCTAAPNDASTGATITEVANSNGYARVTQNPSTSNWAATSGGNGTTSNSTTITFPTATGSWGTATHFAVVDSSTYGAGNVLFYGPLTSSVTIGTGVTASFPAGSLVIALD